MAVFVILIAAVGFVMFDIDNENPRTPASIPANYEALKACEKQDVLWEKAQATVYKELPEYKKMGLPQLMGMGMQELQIKGNLHSDFAPDGWKKYLHRRGALAKIKIIPMNNVYSGIFQGAECGILRLSLTYKTAGDKPVAPGLALKVLRDGTYSANVSALVSLEGQEKDFNFFKHPMSNIVPISSKLGQKLVHKIFNKTSQYPEELVLTDMANIDSQGKKLTKTISPRQLFFIPGKSVKEFSSSEHDVRDDFLKIPEGTIVYHLYALPEKYSAFDYSNYSADKANSFVKESEHVADIVTTSEFVASEFGDDGIFFRHQLRP